MQKSGKAQVYGTIAHRFDKMVEHVVNVMFGRLRHSLAIGYAGNDIFESAQLVKKSQRADFGVSGRRQVVFFIRAKYFHKLFAFSFARNVRKHFYRVFRRFLRFGVDIEA